MSRMTNWRQIADRDFFYDDFLDHDGAAYYELAVYNPKTDAFKIVYCGETCNEYQRMKAYGKHGSHKSEEIASYLNRGWLLMYRARATKSKKIARRTQDNLIKKYYYPWNIAGN